MVRLYCLATANGAAAGAIAAITFWAMLLVQAVIWGTFDARWMIPIVCIVGGVLIGWTRLQSAGPDLEEQIAQAHDPERIQRREMLFVAIGAVVAVGFGGAIGPEAGILALVSQLSTFVAMKLGRTHAERVTIAEAGVSGGLGGFYGSPAGGAVRVEGERKLPKPILFVAAIAGFLAFVVTARVVMGPGGLSALRLPIFEAPAGDYDVLIAIIPALVGALVGTIYLAARTWMTGWIENSLPNAFWQPVVGGALFGLLALAFPLLRFSGHNELEHLIEAGAETGLVLLLVLAAGKAIATAICISTHWQGGVIYPMAFAGGAAGIACAMVMPGIDPTTAVVAAMAGACAVGMALPMVAGLILLFLIGGGLAVPVMVGSLIGYFVLQRLPETMTAAVHGHGSPKPDAH